MQCDVLCTASVPQYLSKFQWDFAKYSNKQSLKNIGEIIAKVICHLLLSDSCSNQQSVVLNVSSC